VFALLIVGLCSTRVLLELGKNNDQGGVCQRGMATNLKFLRTAPRQGATRPKPGQHQLL